MSIRYHFTNEFQEVIAYLQTWKHPGVSTPPATTTSVIRTYVAVFILLPVTTQHNTCRSWAGSWRATCTFKHSKWSVTNLWRRRRGKSSKRCVDLKFEFRARTFHTSNSNYRAAFPASSGIQIEHLCLLDSPLLIEGSAALCRRRTRMKMLPSLIHAHVFMILEESYWTWGFAINVCLLRVRTLIHIVARRRFVVLKYDSYAEL